MVMVSELAVIQLLSNGLFHFQENTWVHGEFYFRVDLFSFKFTLMN